MIQYRKDKLIRKQALLDNQLKKESQQIKEIEGSLNENQNANDLEQKNENEEDLENKLEEETEEETKQQKLQVSIVVKADVDGSLNVFLWLRYSRLFSFLGCKK